MTNRFGWWGIWFLFIAMLTYSPAIAPYGTPDPFIMGYPFTLFWWLVLSLVLVASIIIFAITEKGGFE